MSDFNDRVRVAGVSSNIRRNILTRIMAVPHSRGEQNRLAALIDYRLLDAEPEDAYTDIVRLAAFICGTPIATVSLIDKDRQWFKAVTGLDYTEVSRDAAFCSHTILQPDLLIVPDTHADPRFTDNPQVTGNPNIRFYAGVPLVTEEGFALGALCVIDREPRNLTEDQEDALKKLARQVVRNMEMARQGAIQERRLGDVLESFTDAFFAVDREWLFTYVNHHAELVLFRRRSDLLGQSLWDEFPGAVDSTFEQEFRRAAREGVPVSFVEFYAPLSAWFEVRAYPSRDGLTVYFQDISAERQSEDALKESRRRLAEAQSVAKVGSWEYDVASDKLIWSDELFRIMNMDPAHGEPTVFELRTCFHPEDLPAYREMTGRALSDGSVYELDIRVLQRDGSVRWTQACGQGEVNEAGLVTRLFGTLLDIHARKMAEGQAQSYYLELEVQKEVLEAANAELAALATTDGLTGLLNHRFFHNRLEEEAARSQRENTTLAVVMLDLDNFKFFNDVYGHAVGDNVLRLIAQKLHLACRSYDILARFGGDEFAVLMPNIGAISAEAVEKRLRTTLGGLTHYSETDKTAIPITISVGAALFPYDGQDWQEVLYRADKRLMRSKSGGGSETEADQMRTEMGQSLEGFSMLDALVTAVDNKDRYTRRHSEDVMEYSLMIGREMGLDTKTLHTVAVAALLHDVGKIGIPDNILRKPGKLTDEEYRAIKQHPQLGLALATTVPGLEGTLDAVHHHHERWDGGGYPFGLHGDKTPLMARLMAVADAFSAMTTDRPYRKGIEKCKALEILEAGAGTQWDPRCVAAFLATMQHGVSDPLPHINSIID